ncbi:MAG: TolC family protein, partial [Gemmatimonadales bacterium]
MILRRLSILYALSATWPAGPAAAQGRSDTLTLDQALERARRNRPQLLVARAARAEARAGLGVASAIPNPVLQYKHTEGSPSEEAIVEQRLDWLFTRWTDRSAARAGLRGAEADSIILAAELGRNVRLAFFHALAAERTHDLVLAMSRSADSLVGFAVQRVRAGDLSAQEREQVSVEAGRVRQLLSRAAEARAAARAELGRELGSPSAETTPAGALDRGLDGTWPAAAGEESLPIVRRAVADSAAEHARARGATIRRLPIPSLRLGREWDDQGPFSEGATGVVGFSVPVPLWNIGSSAAGLARARADRAAAAAGEARLEA